LNIPGTNYKKADLKNMAQVLPMKKRFKTRNNSYQFLLPEVKTTLPSINSERNLHEQAKLIPTVKLTSIFSKKTKEIDTLLSKK
jgi:hypothetical protein